MLIVFGGLPGTGKSTLAKEIALESNGLYLRIDSIEQALRDMDRLKDRVHDAGYRVAYAVAADNLRLGARVIADSVNPVMIARNVWREVAASTGAPLVEIEIICSDVTQHRHRVETRPVDVAGLSLPTWEAVKSHDYEPWDRPHIVIDTANRTVGEVLAELRALIKSAAA